MSKSYLSVVIHDPSSSPLVLEKALHQNNQNNQNNQYNLTQHPFNRPAARRVCLAHNASAPKPIHPTGRPFLSGKLRLDPLLPELDAGESLPPLLKLFKNE